MKILISAGPTREAIDPVRFITNHSSGKMGYALAQAAVKRGWQVILVSGPVDLPRPEGLAEFVQVVSAAEMADAVKSRFPAMDGAILCAAVADYRPVTVSNKKIKKSDDDLILHLERTEDILKTLGTMKNAQQILIGFAAETDDLEANALAKLKKKNLDWIAANDVSRSDIGFGSNDNAVTLYGRNSERIQLPVAPKAEIAAKLLDTVLTKA